MVGICLVARVQSLLDAAQLKPHISARIRGNRAEVAPDTGYPRDRLVRHAQIYKLLYTRVKADGRLIDRGYPTHNGNASHDGRLP
jgi:hypothetical protein